MEVHHQYGKVTLDQSYLLQIIVLMKEQNEKIDELIKETKKANNKLDDVNSSLIDIEVDLGSIDSNTDRR